MEISGTRASYGLSTSAVPSSPKSSGSIPIGDTSINLAITGADVFFVTEAVIGEVSGEFIVDIEDNDASGSDAFSAGTQQVETATAAGTITTAGNGTATVTSSSLTGSPKSVSFAVALDDTAAEWAEKARTALAADTDVAAIFDVSGATTAIILTRKTNLGCAFANDATLNIALANDDSAGITTAATSANTTAGVAATGASLNGGEGKDFEGNTIESIGTVQSVAIRCTSGGATFICGNEEGEISAGEYRNITNIDGIAGLPDVATFTSTAIQTGISITVTGIAS